MWTHGIRWVVFLAGWLYNKRELQNYAFSYQYTLFVSNLINRNTYHFQHCVPCLATCSRSWFGTSWAGCLKYRVQGQSKCNEECHSNHNQFRCHVFSLWKLIIFSDTAVFRTNLRKYVSMFHFIFDLKQT